jgi:hypothetical protein
VRCPRCSSTELQTLSRRPGLGIWIVVLTIWAFLGWFAFVAPPIVDESGRYAVLAALGLLSAVILLAGGDAEYRCRQCLSSWNEGERGRAERAGRLPRRWQR